MNNMKYVNDSLAHDFDLFAERPVNEKKVIELPKKRVSKPQVKKSILSKIAIFSLFAVIICSLFVNIFIRAQISEISNEINKSEAEYQELKSEETRLSVQLQKKSTVANLENQAKAMGMQKEDKNQVNYVFLYEDENSEESADVQ